MRSHLKFVLLCLLPWHTAHLFGQPVATNSNSRFAPIIPFPNLAAVAQSNQISLAGIDPFTANGGLKPGDSIAALIAFHEKKTRQTQWLLHLQVVPPDDKEKTNSPAPPMVLYTTTGARLEFTNAPAFVSLRTLGPFAEPDARKPPKLQDQIERVTLNEGFLALGLDHASAVVLRLNAANVTHRKGLFSFSGKPFNDAEVTAGRKLAEELHLTEAEQRAMAGVGPALISYFSIVQRTAGLDDILFKLIDLPSLWSILRRGGVVANFRMESKRIAPARAADWDLPAGIPLYHLPFVLELNNQPALNVTLAVTSPQSPLLACGGIVGLMAERPGDEERFLTVRTVTARRAATTQ